MRGWSFGISPRRGLEHVVGHRLVAGLVQGGDDRGELGAGLLLVDGRRGSAASAVGSGMYSPPPTDRPVGARTTRIPTPIGRRAVGLVRRLVGAEPDVAVGPEDLARAELVGELGEQLLHRGLDVAVVDRLVVLPVDLGVVGLQALVELDRLDGPSRKRHGSIAGRGWRSRPETGGCAVTAWQHEGIAVAGGDGSRSGRAAVSAGSASATPGDGVEAITFAHSSLNGKDYITKEITIAPGGTHRLALPPRPGVRRDQGGHADALRQRTARSTASTAPAIRSPRAAGPDTCTTAATRDPTRW